MLLGHEPGRLAGGSAVRAGNTRTDSAHNRYQIAPIELVKIQREATQQGLDIAGSIIRIPIIRRNGRLPISPKRTGSAAAT